MRLLCGIAICLIVLVDRSRATFCVGSVLVEAFPICSNQNVKMSLNSSHVCFKCTRQSRNCYQGSLSQVSQSCPRSPDIQPVPSTFCPPVSHTVCQDTTVNTVVTVTNLPGSSCNQSANMLRNRRDSSDAAVIGILGGIVVILAIAVIGLSLVVIYYHKGKNNRVKSQANDPPIDNPVYGTSTIASVKTQNSADLAAGHMETDASGGEEEAGREGSINSENYIIPREEDSSKDSASAQSYEVPVNKCDDVGEEEEDEYREFFIPAKISKVQDYKFQVSTQDKL